MMNFDTHRSPPPPYTSSKPTAVIAETPSRAAGEESRALPDLPDGRWNLACNIGVTGPQMQLRSDGTLHWMRMHEDAKSERYEKDGLIIIKGPREIKVAFQDTEWACDSSSTAGRLLSDIHRQVRLIRLAHYLVVYEQTSINENPGRPPSKPREDQLGPLKVETASSGIVTITGAVIHQVDGDGDDIVIVTSHQSQNGGGNAVGQAVQDFSLWDMKKGKWRWKHSHQKPGTICGFTKKFILMKVGNVHLHRRTDGTTYGDFKWPSFTAFIDLNPDHHHGPVTSTSGLFLYVPCKKAVFVWQVRDKSVHFRIWESAADIQGPLALRGSFEQLELVPYR